MFFKQFFPQFLLVFQKKKPNPVNKHTKTPKFIPSIVFLEIVIEFE